MSICSNRLRQVSVKIFGACLRLVGFCCGVPASVPAASPIYRLHQQPRADHFHPVMDIARGVRFGNRKTVLQQNAARVDVLLQLKSGDAGFVFPLMTAQFDRAAPRYCGSSDPWRLTVPIGGAYSKRTPATCEMQLRFADRR